MSIRLPYSILTNVEREPSTLGRFHWVVMIDGVLLAEGDEPARPIAQERCVQCLTDFFRQIRAETKTPADDDGPT